MNIRLGNEKTCVCRHGVKSELCIQTCSVNDELEFGPSLMFWFVFVVEIQSIKVEPLKYLVVQGSSKKSILPIPGVQGYCDNGRHLLEKHEKMGKIQLWVCMLMLFEGQFNYCCFTAIQSLNDVDRIPFVLLTIFCSNFTQSCTDSLVVRLTIFSVL